MNVDQFREQIFSEIQFVANDKKISEQEAFVEIISEDLIDSENIDDFTQLNFEGIGKRNKKIQIDGYDFSELDNLLRIFIAPSLVYPEKISLTSIDAKIWFNRAQNFIEDADFIIENAEESSPGYGLAYDILNKFKNVDKYAIYLLTDMQMSSRIKQLDRGEVNGKSIDYNIFDIERIFGLRSQKNIKEDITINLLDFENGAIPYLPASKTDDYTAYLCNIPGLLLAKLYNEYGSRLLEGNVRSFLQTKGKVNKGIRRTILTEPSKFFAYNNGIAATATSIKCENVNGTNCITEITGLQIVNGGQTTASLANCYLKDKKDNSIEKIKEIYVPMKLSVVEPEIAKVLIPEISEYANTQNKVSASDLSSNHPFHRRMEEISRRIVAPAYDGMQYGTHWYYERANGQYRQETYKATEAEKRKFESQNPKNQVFKKTDLAKYINIWHCRPDIASAGAQKSFSQFTSWLSSEWDRNENSFNDNFFKDLVSLAILFKTTDNLVKRMGYNSYKANIVVYSISKLFDVVNKKYPDRCIDLTKIWQKQELSKSFENQLKNIIPLIYNLLVSEYREVENVTEWAKRQKCWDLAQQFDLKLNEDFENELQYKENEIQRKKDSKKDQKLTNSVNQMKAVAEFGEGNWLYLLNWNKDHKVLTPTEENFIKVAANMMTRFPSEKQCAKIMSILEKAREESFPK